MFGQPFQDTLSGVGGQVQGGPFLVQVQQQKEKALFRMRVVVMERPHPAQAGPSRRFQLQNIGPIVGHQASAKRTGNVLTEVEHLYTAEGSV